MRDDSPFDPPRPPKPSALETLGLGAAAVALVVADACTGSVLRTLASIPAGGDQEPIDVAQLERSIPGLTETAAPTQAPDGNVVCSRCATAVPFESMSLNEHGYFCASCARAVTPG